MGHQGQLKKKTTSPTVDDRRVPAAEAGDIYRVLRADSGEAAAAERLIHQRTRLAIVSMLAVNDSLTFNELKELLQATDRQPECACPQARGGRLHRLQEVF